MQFDKFWRAFRYKKGLVIDVRGNGGGWTEYFMIDKLERQQVAFNVLKGMEPYRYPNPASRAHFVLVSNEDNGSDGEAFVEHFKARKLGTVVGVPSWGGLVGIVNGQRTIDNGRVEQSNNAFYGREGKWLVENHGARPRRPAGQRSRVGDGRQGPAAREGGRGGPPEDQGPALAVPAGAGLPEEVGPRHPGAYSSGNEAKSRTPSRRPRTAQLRAERGWPRATSSSGWPAMRVRQWSRQKPSRRASAGPR